MGNRDADSPTESITSQQKYSVSTSVGGVENFTSIWKSMVPSVLWHIYISIRISAYLSFSGVPVHKTKIKAFLQDSVTLILLPFLLGFMVFFFLENRDSTCWQLFYMLKIKQCFLSKTKWCFNRKKKKSPLELHFFVKFNSEFLYRVPVVAYWKKHASL